MKKEKISCGSLRPVDFHRRAHDVRVEPWTAYILSLILSLLFSTSRFFFASSFYSIPTHSTCATTTMGHFFSPIFTLLTGYSSPLHFFLCVLFYINTRASFPGLASLSFALCVSLIFCDHAVPVYTPLSHSQYFTRPPWHSRERERVYNVRIRSIFCHWQTTGLFSPRQCI